MCVCARVCVCFKLMVPTYFFFQTRAGVRGVQGRYEPGALLRNEEDAIVIGGLLVGLNTIDCNLCLKPEKNKNDGKCDRASGEGEVDDI